MGSMSSPAPGIKNLHFQKIPSKPVTGMIVKVEDVILVKGDRGALYTNVKALARNLHCMGAWEWSENVMEALDQLKLLTAEDKAAHAAYLDRQEKRREAVDALIQAVDASAVKSLGITNKKLVKLWDALDFYGQNEYVRYGRKKPVGAKNKPNPKEMTIQV